MAVKLAKLKANVYALSKTKKNLDLLTSEEKNITSICVDLSDWNATKYALENLPPIHCLVNNAGIAILGPFLEAKPEEFDK